MPFCKKCGTQTAQGAAFCPSCGEKADSTQQPQYQQPPYQQQSGQQYQSQQQGYHQQSGNDATNNKAMGILAYLGILVLVPIFAAKESRFARFHANQGLVLAITEIAYGIVISIINAIMFAISWRIAAITGTIFGILWLGFLAFSILGIINAANGKTDPLPVIGNITILK